MSVSLVMTEKRHSKRTQHLHDRHEVISRLARGMICKIQRKNGNFIEIQHQLLAVKEFYAQFDGEIIP
jgi:hypothetical protein